MDMRAPGQYVRIIISLCRRFVMILGRIRLWHLRLYTSGPNVLIILIYNILTIPIVFVSKDWVQLDCISTLVAMGVAESIDKQGSAVLVFTLRFTVKFDYESGKILCG